MANSFKSGPKARITTTVSTGCDRARSQSNVTTTDFGGWTFALIRSLSQTVELTCLLGQKTRLPIGKFEEPDIHPILPQRIGLRQ